MIVQVSDANRVGSFHCKEGGFLIGGRPLAFYATTCKSIQEADEAEPGGRIYLLRGEVSFWDLLDHY